MDYVLDTNTLIQYLRDEPNVLQNFDDAVTNKCNFIIPKAVDYELRRGFGIHPAKKKEAVYTIFIQQCTIGELDFGVWDYAMEVYIELYKKRFTVGEMDILIGAFCLAHDYTLVTSNIKDFINIDGIKLVDWTQPQYGGTFCV